ncbi:helix-turn-helix domain-containing protein [Streptomyces sp. TP-A0356]|uniref:helix-turn-helix domain-containing protein n=1 Tax=Streptomyces sp. TP-A0356 TaxID=1359208 RepID=UPI0006E32B12|nr:helix-turn-helix domain-containing protein [Streptomyces sp. TP-A0356]
MHKRKWITGGAREELAAVLAREYGEGRSIRAIAEAHGRSYGFVHRVLTEAGVPLRSRRGSVRPDTTRPVR